MKCCMLLISMQFALAFHQLIGTLKFLVINYNDHMASPHTIIVKNPSLRRGDVLTSSAIVFRGAKR